MSIQNVLTNNLTPEQYHAAMDANNEILCLACAGSGKSRTLAYRIARLVAAGASPESIVAFTFTEKASESIKRRVGEALSNAGMDVSLIGAMYIGTIHAYCKYLLGEMDARYRQYEVLDPNRMKLYLISRYASLRVHIVRSQRAAIRTQLNRQATSQSYFDTIDNICECWSNLNDELLTISDITSENTEIGNTLQAIYDGLHREQFLDYSLMIRLIVDALRNNDPRIIRAISAVGHLMVDEYQDVNPAQEALIRGIHQVAGTLFVVGDDDQAIYSWRGADVSNILSFQNRYPRCSQHFLSTNFRSTPVIVEAASGFVSRQLGSQRMLKSPVAAPQNALNHNQVSKQFFATREEEGNWVAHRIQELLGKCYPEASNNRGLCPSDFAILMKSTNTEEQDGSLRHSAYTRALDALGIPYFIESQGSIFNYAAVRVLWESFELLRNNNLDRPILTNFFNTHILIAFPNADFNRTSAVLSEWNRLIHQPITMGRRKVKPQQLLHDLLNAFQIQSTTFSDIEMHAMGMFSKVMQDIESVYLSIDTTSRFVEVLNFIGNVANGSYETSPDIIIQRPNAVFVSTIHGAKGLEFPVVFVVDVQSGRFPGSRRNYNGWLPQRLMQPALARGAYQNTREGEIRLFYTAITRAERFLYVTGSQTLPGGARRYAPSSFGLDLQHPQIQDGPVPLPDIPDATPVQRIDETIMPTSFSEIKYYLICPKNYQFRKQYGFNPHVPDLYGYGQTVHTSIGKLHELFLNRAPSMHEAEQITRETFHLKHVPPARDPVNSPGPYERALEKAVEVVTNYSRDYGTEFSVDRQIEVRFEIPANQSIITGSIDLLIKQDSNGNITEATVIDFKSLEKPDDESVLDWIELSMQVQLYAKAATEVLGNYARTGAVHLLRSNERIDVPIDNVSIDASIANIEWAVNRIISRDFPMRPHADKCRECDFSQLCAKQLQSFTSSAVPPPINLPLSVQPTSALIKAFSQV